MLLNHLETKSHIGVTIVLVLVILLLFPAVASPLVSYTATIFISISNLINDTIFFVDNNNSDVDSTADTGSHSNFTAQQYGLDSIYDTLIEDNEISGGFGEFIWISGNDDQVRKLNKSDIVGPEILSWDTGTSYPFACEYKIEDDNEYVYVLDSGVGPNSDILIKFNANNGSEVTRWDISSYAGNAEGLAWNGSRWFIAERADHLIFQVDPNDPTVAERSFSYAGQLSCAGLAWDGSYLWAVDFGTDKVYQIDLYGNIQTSWDFVPSNPVGVAYDTTLDHLWIVADTGYLYEYFINGTEINSWDTPGILPKGVSYASTLDFQLDLEVQWTDVDFDEVNEELCIFGGTMGTEDIGVDVWTGVVWQNLFADLNVGWNNVTISSYLSASTFTIRFKGNIETNDSVQDYWEIDTTLIHAWS